MAEDHVEVPQLPTGPLTDELEAEAKRRLETAGLRYGGAIDPGCPIHGPFVDGVRLTNLVDFCTCPALRTE